jgi:hypothetical protein
MCAQIRKVVEMQSVMLDPSANLRILRLVILTRQLLQLLVTCRRGLATRSTRWENGDLSEMHFEKIVEIAEPPKMKWSRIRVQEWLVQVQEAA